MKALVLLCFLALILVCQATPHRGHLSSLSSLEELSNPRHLSSLDDLLQNRRHQTNLLQALNGNTLLRSLELQQLRRLLNSVDVNSRKNPPPEVHTRPYDFGID